jgi:hypothetical protein
MVYENTHLWAANAIKKQITNSILREIISTNIDHYHLGAVFPDTLYYSDDSKIKDIANFLHGDTNTPTNKIVFDVLDRIKRTQNDTNLAFICGYLTHCAMDIVFHPVVFYFSGYKKNSGAQEQARSSYLHWHYETFIDKRFNETFFLHHLIKPAVVDDLTVFSVLKISKRTIRNCLAKQISYFRRIHSRLFYNVYRVLAKIGWVEKKYIAGFYANLDVDQNRLAEKIEYQDIISGRTKKATLDGLMANAIEMGVKMVESAYDYYRGNISRQDCERIVVGKNLDTGQGGKTKADIRYSIHP